MTVNGNPYAASIWFCGVR